MKCWIVEEYGSVEEFELKWKVSVKINTNEVLQKRVKLVELM